MIVLFRLVKEQNMDARDGLVAGILLGVAVIVNFIPSRVLHRWPSPWPELYSFAHLAIWLAMLIFLAIVAWRQVRDYRSALTVAKKAGCLAAGTAHE
jgi:uncharacterized protein (DUF983 family)